MLPYLCAKLLQLCLTLCNPVDCSPPSSMRFSRPEQWNGLPFPPPVDLPNAGIELMSPVSPALQEDSLPAEPSGKPYYARYTYVFLFGTHQRCVKDVIIYYR